jgi:hypothetical protein
MTQGTAEKERLETMLYEKTTPGMGDSDPAMFFVG